MSELDAKVKRARYRDWYKENKERMSAKRRKQYAESKEYRDQALRRSAEYRRQKLGRVGDGKVEKTWKGRKVICIRVGALAELTDVRPATISKLHRQGIIPESLFEGYRLYTPNQVKMLQQFLPAWAKAKSRHEKQKVANRWTPKLHDRWEN